MISLESSRSMTMASLNLRLGLDFSSLVVGKRRRKRNPLKKRPLQLKKRLHLLMMVERRRKRRRRLPSKMFCHKCHNLSQCNNACLQRINNKQNELTTYYYYYYSPLIKYCIMSTCDLLKNMFLCYVEEHITVPLINDHTARKNLSICDDLHLYVTSTPQNDEQNRNRNLDCAKKIKLFSPQKKKKKKKKKK